MAFKREKKIRTWMVLFFCCTALAGCMRENESLRDQREFNMALDLQFITNEIPPVPSKLSLQDIINIALEQNLDLEVKRREFEVQFQVVMREQLKLLPKVIINAESSQRNNELIVSSRSVEPGIPPAPPSISTDRYVNRNDISLVLNLLDFGLSYYKAKQEANRAFIISLEYERASQTIVLEITKQYWKAAAAKVAIDESGQLFAAAKGLQNRINNQILEKVLPKSKGLKIESDLVALQVQLSGFETIYYTAMSELSLLMGLSPNTPFEIELDYDFQDKIELIDVCSLESIALRQRSELYSKDMAEKITEDEIRYAFLQMLPGIELFAGNYFDANSFFTNKHWVVAGARGTWNLLKIPSVYFDRKSAIERRELVKIQRIAQSVAVLSQVRLAYILYQENYDQYKIVDTLREINQSLLMTINEEFNQGTASQAEVIFAQAQALFSKINALKSYGELQISLEQVNYSIGSPRYYSKENNIKYMEYDF